MSDRKGREPGRLKRAEKALLNPLHPLLATHIGNKGWVLLPVLIFLGILVLFAAAYKISETSFFCGVCHNMTVYVDSWKGSTHKHVPCIDCHYKPGFVNHLKGKWTDGQLSLAYFVTGKRPTRPHAEIDDLSCLQSGCHRKEDLKRPLAFKNVIFNHAQHLDKIKREKQLRCTTCHSQIVQGSHMTVTEVECFICHFYKTKGQKEYITGCTSCHFEAKGDIKLKDFVFNHKKYLARKVKCETCHNNVVTGDGHIQENSCLKCHNKREILEAKYTAAQLHKNHVTNHKVECFECHTGIKHRIAPIRHMGDEKGTCTDDCHGKQTHSAKVSMYLGTGARGLKAMPSQMAQVNLHCSICHETGAKKMDTACASCHGQRTDGMVALWKKNIKKKEDGLAKEIADLKVLVEQKKAAPELRKKFDDALFNFDFLQQGNPMHNIVYSSAVADVTRNLLGEVRHGLAGTAWKPVSSKITCTDMCHGDMGEKKISFGNTSFQHMVHAEGEDSCIKCHSPYKEHGKTFYQGCSSCHHGEGMGKVTCRDCHRAEDRLLRAKGAVHGKVACVDCHSTVATGKRGAPGTVKANCIRCHKKSYGATLDDWLKKSADVTRQWTGIKTGLVKDIEGFEARDGKHSVPLRKVLDDIIQDVNTITAGRYGHNPAYSDTLAQQAGKNAAVLQKMMDDKKAGKAMAVPGK